jgi:hypothetical protein
MTTVARLGKKYKRSYAAVRMWLIQGGLPYKGRLTRVCAEYVEKRHFAARNSPSRPINRKPVFVSAEHTESPKPVVTKWSTEKQLLLDLLIEKYVDER